LPSLSSQANPLSPNFFVRWCVISAGSIHFSRIIYPLSVFWLQIRIKKRTTFLPIDSKMTTSQLWFNLLPVIASLLTVIFSLTNVFLYILGKLINS